MHLIWAGLRRRSLPCWGRSLGYRAEGDKHMQNDKKENLTAATRRNFALGASVVGLAISSARSAEAQTTGSGSGSGSSNTGDIAILNYALTLENIEANFYATGLSKYSVNDFANAAFAQAIGAG